VSPPHARKRPGGYGSTAPWNWPGKSAPAARRLDIATVEKKKSEAGPPHSPSPSLGGPGHIWRSATEFVDGRSPSSQPRGTLQHVRGLLASSRRLGVVQDAAARWYPGSISSTAQAWLANNPRAETHQGLIPSPPPRPPPGSSGGGVVPTRRWAVSLPVTCAVRLQPGRNACHGRPSAPGPARPGREPPRATGEGVSTPA
jgi:hypothetical protein